MSNEMLYCKSCGHEFHEDLVLQGSANYEDYGDTIVLIDHNDACPNCGREGYLETLEGINDSDYD